MAFAAERGVSIEIVAILDRPDSVTRSFFQQQGDVRYYEVDFGDSGLSRNFGVRQSYGRYINFLDGDDLFSRSWLWKAFDAAEQAGHPTVWTPQFSVVFENENFVWRHPSSNDPDFRPEQLIDFCHWLPGLLVPREIALQFPFAECHPRFGLRLGRLALALRDAGRRRDDQGGRRHHVLPSPPPGHAFRDPYSDACGPSAHAALRFLGVETIRNPTHIARG